MQPSRSTLASRERFGSAEESEAPSEFGTDNLLEGYEEANERRWEHDVPNPLRLHGTEARAGAAEDHGGHTEGDEDLTHQSSWLRTLGIGNSDGTKVVLGERGKRPVSVEVERELRRGRMAGQSLKGDVAFI